MSQLSNLGRFISWRATIVKMALGRHSALWVRKPTNVGLSFRSVDLTRLTGLG